MSAIDQIYAEFRALEGRHHAAASARRRELWRQLERARARQPDPRRRINGDARDLAAYVHQVERYGPECVIESAREDLDDEDLGQLRAFIAWKERTHAFRNGQWVERRDAASRACAFCGRDLPPHVDARTKYHPHCVRRAQYVRLRKKGAGDRGD